jgi:hypothetical protein
VRAAGVVRGAGGRGRAVSVWPGAHQLKGIPAGGDGRGRPPPRRGRAQLYICTRRAQRARPLGGGRSGLWADAAGTGAPHHRHRHLAPSWLPVGRRLLMTSTSGWGLTPVAHTHVAKGSCSTAPAAPSTSRWPWRTAVTLWGQGRGGRTGGGVRKLGARRSCREAASLSVRACERDPSLCGGRAVSDGASPQSRGHGAARRAGMDAPTPKGELRPQAGGPPAAAHLVPRRTLMPRSANTWAA